MSRSLGAKRAEIIVAFYRCTDFRFRLLESVPPSVFFKPVSLSDGTLQRYIGQMIVTGFSGDTAEATDFQRVVRNLEDGVIGGVLFLPNNIASKKELERMLKIVND